MKSTRIQLVLFAILLGLLSLETFVDIFPDVQLSGAFILAEAPEFNSESWHDGAFQKGFDTYTNDNIGFKGLNVKLFNQVDYSLFNVIHAANGDVGKNGYFFGEGIETYFGSDLVEKHLIIKKMKLVKKVQDQLAVNGTHLVVVFAPNKAYYYPEYFSGRYADRKKGIGNYEAFLEEAQNQGINVLDMNNYFITMKGSEKHPLYSTTGDHWTEYGVVLAADTISKYIANTIEKKIPTMNIDGVEISHTARSVDADIEDASNLFFNVEKPLLAYPQVSYNSTGAYMPKVLSVSDCYYGQIYESNLTKGLFYEDGSFWFYNREIKSTGGENYTDLKVVNKKEIAGKQDVIIVMMTVHNLDEFGFGFFEELNAAQNPDELDFSLALSFMTDQITKHIRADEEWKQMIKNQARERKLSYKSMERRAAAYTAKQKIARWETELDKQITGLPKGADIEVFRNKHIKEVLKKECPEYFTEKKGNAAPRSLNYGEVSLELLLPIIIDERLLKIDADSTWKSNVAKQASIHKISLDEMMHRAASYSAKLKIKKLEESMSAPNNQEVIRAILVKEYPIYFRAILRQRFAELVAEHPNAKDAMWQQAIKELQIKYGIKYSK